MELKKTNIDGKFYNVISRSTLNSNKEFYNSSMNAVEFKDDDGKEYVLPIRPLSDLSNRPGFNLPNSSSPVSFYSLPKEEDEVKYSKKNKAFTDFSNCETLAETIEKQESIRNIERDILTNPDNITSPNVSSLDSPEMRGLKEAVIAKNIDIDKYKDRFGDNFPNDKRVLKSHEITQKMLKRMTDKLDIKITMIFEDASSDVPNPMGKKIIVDLTGNNEDN